MAIRAKAITTLALLFMMVITIGACTPKVYLPVLYEAPGFTLTNQDRLEVELSDFRGKVVVVDFIYTRCPDVCGELNYRLQGVWEQLKQELKQDFVLISVSFDLYDTPEVLKQYDKFYDVPGWQFLTGTEEQIRQVTNDYGLGVWGEEPAPEGSPTVEITHTVVIVLIDRNGMVRKTYGDPYFPKKDMIRELDYLLKQ
jgi:protein SCO1/2